MAADYEEHARVFRALCDEKRLRILELLRGGEKCACVLLEQLDLGQSGLSYHMMLKVDFQSIKNVGKNPKGLFVTWVTNWLIKPFTMPALALQPFADESEIKTAYQTDVSRSVILGLVVGTGNNYVRPRDAATRAQAVTIVGRLAGLLQQYKSNVAVKASAQESDGQLQMTLSVLNNTGKAITIHHSNGQLFDFEILDKSGNKLYRWSDGRMFSMAQNSAHEPGISFPSDKPRDLSISRHSPLWYFRDDGQHLVDERVVQDTAAILPFMPTPQTAAIL